MTTNDGAEAVTNTATAATATSDATTTSPPTTTNLTTTIIPAPEKLKLDFKDNGIFEFVEPERAIELYKRIHSNGIPELDWKFYGRRKPNEIEQDGNQEAGDCNEETQNRDQEQKEPENTEFDFDLEFNDLQLDNSTVNDGLQLKKRPEPGSEKKTNLSDIIGDIMKETSHTEIE